MASSSIGTLILFSLVAGVLCNYNILDFDLTTKHDLWMAEHGRAYKNEAEKAWRFEIFKQNLKYIEDFNNAGEHSYTLGVNQFADLTDEEFMNMYTGGFSESELEESLTSIESETMESLNHSAIIIPSSVDWRNVGAVTPVVSQGSCGSCWAHAAIAAVESVIKIRKGVLHTLSRQQLVDCDTTNNGCHGGQASRAYTYIRNNGGLTSEDNYPYVARRGSCMSNKAKKIVATIRGFRQVDKFEDLALAATVVQQPVSVDITVAPEFKLYKSGIFDGPCRSKRHHAVTVVGYAATKGKDKYWIVKNSWGTKWGEKGYIRLKRRVPSADGTCGILRNPTYPIV